MAFITQYRGRLVDHTGKFDKSMLLQEISLEEYLAQQYPSGLQDKYPEQSRRDSEREREAIGKAISAGDSLWLWRHVEQADRTDESSIEFGGLAILRAGKVIRVFLVWSEW